MLLPKGPGGEKDSQPVEAVEDGAPEDQFLHGRTEEYDDQDYRRYGHARALLYPANEPFHKRLLDRRFRRVAEPFEDEDADRVYDHAKENGTDADGQPNADSRQDTSPRTRESQRRQGVSYLPTEAPHQRDRDPEPRDHRPCDGCVQQDNREQGALRVSHRCFPDRSYPWSIHRPRHSGAAPLWRPAEAGSPSVPRRLPSVLP